MGKKKKSETTLQIYVNEEFGEIRTAGTWDNPLFCLADVCHALEIGNPSDVKKRLEDGVVTIEVIFDSLGRKQNAVFVNEDGLYDVILDSRKPEAKKFRKWITSEVLPSIRKTGVYAIDKKYQKWLASRQHGTLSRKDETSVIKIFIDYARNQGCTWEDKFFYSTITIWCNVGAGLPKRNGRDLADIQQLNTLDLLEGTIVKNILLNGIAEGLHYTQIWAKTQLQIKMFLEITFQNPELLT